MSIISQKSLSGSLSPGNKLFSYQDEAKDSECSSFLYKLSVKFALFNSSLFPSKLSSYFWAFLRFCRWTGLFLSILYISWTCFPTSQIWKPFHLLSIFQKCILISILLWSSFLLCLFSWICTFFLKKILTETVMVYTPITPAFRRPRQDCESLSSELHSKTLRGENTLRIFTHL